MKIALLLTILGTATILAGCSTERGGTADQYNTSSGSMQQTAPVVTDPSLPQDSNAGPMMPPP